VPPSCADCLEILGSSTSYRPQPVPACIGIASFTFAKLVGEHKTYLKEYLPHFQADCRAKMRARATINRGNKRVAAIKESQHVPFQGRHDCRLATACTNETKKCTGGRARATASPFSPCVCSRDKRRKATVILLTGDYTKTIGLVKALTACHAFSIPGRPFAGYEAHVERASLSGISF
jgi:hypothetical protein